MFVRYYLELPLPAGRVEQVIFHAPADWLSTVAGHAHQRGHHLLTQAGVGPLGPAWAGGSTSSSARRSGSRP
jgi:hypothetical protein